MQKAASINSRGVLFLRRLYFKNLVFILTLVLPMQGYTQTTENCKLKIGTNLAGPQDYGSEWPFVNIMKYAREWGTQNIMWVGGGQNPWDSELANAVPQDDQGYPLEVPFSWPGMDTLQIFYTVWANTEALPSGTYILLYEGEGTIDFRFDGTVISSAPGRLEVEVTPGLDDIMQLKILESKAGNHIRNIRFLLPGTEDTNQTNPWTDSWLEKVAPFDVLRFMDWGYTNNSTLRKWSDRTLVDDYTYTQRAKSGIPYEWWVKACNQLDADAWINIPHLGDDDFLVQMATFFRDNLEPDRTIYVEYTNEYWNWIFDQAHWVNDSLDQNFPWPERYAPRLAHVMQIWTDVFEGQTDRLVRIHASQHAWWDLGWRVLGQLKADGNIGLIDAISPAAYMSTDTDLLASLGAASTAADVLASAQEITFDPDSWHVQGWQQHAAMADSFGLQLLFYEGGQHFTPNPFGSVQPYGSALVDAQFQPEIYDLYNQLFTTLRNLTDADMLFMNFSFIGPTSDRYGSWGVLTDQFRQNPPYFDVAPKYQALLDNISMCDLVNAVDFENESLEIAILPNPTSGLFNLILPETFKPGVARIVDFSGRILKEIECEPGVNLIDLSGLPSGIYSVVMRFEEKVLIKKVVVRS